MNRSVPLVLLSFLLGLPGSASGQAHENDPDMGLFLAQEQLSQQVDLCRWRVDETAPVIAVVQEWVDLDATTLPIEGSGVDPFVLDLASLVGSGKSVQVTAQCHNAVGWGQEVSLPRDFPLTAVPGPPVLSE